MSKPLPTRPLEPPSTSTWYPPVGRHSFFNNQEMSKPRQPKEKVQMPQTPAPEKVKQAGPDKRDIENELDFFMARHHFPNGWKRDIKAIIKPLL